MIVYSHNIDGREEVITDRNNNTTRYVYDEKGNVLTQTDAMGNTISNTYDENGRLASKTDAMGNVTHYTYDKFGNAGTVTDAEGHTVKNEYDSFGQLISLNAMGTELLSITYNSRGYAESMTDALGNVEKYTYDKDNNVSSITDNIGKYMNFTYEKDLESKGFSVNLSTVSTSTLTAKDRFAWDEYDHYDYKDGCGAVDMDKHILYEKDSVKMVGYGWAPLRDWLFVDDGIQAKRVLSFDMIRDKTDWHSMEGGGFLFNTSIREEKTKPEGSEEEVTVKKMNGYCILLCNGEFRLIQFTDMKAMLIVSAASPLRTVPTSCSWSRTARQGSSTLSSPKRSAVLPEIPLTA